MKKPIKALYVFAHEDDDVDVAGKIAADIRAGKQVYCAWVTAGDRGGDPEVRRKEARAAMALVNVPPENLFFMGFPDQFAYKHLKEIYPKLLEIAEIIGPSEIMSHAYEGSNIDHDAVSFVSTIVAKKLNVTHYEFPDTNMYQGRMCVWRFLPDGKSETLYAPLTKELYELKMKVLHVYKSQATGLNAYELAADKSQLKKHGEPYRVVPDYDYTKTPAEALRYESTSKGLATIDMWINAVKDFQSAENIDK